MKKTSIKLKFRTLADKSEEKQGTVYFQVIHGRVTRQIGTSLRIFASEWNAVSEEVISSSEVTVARKSHIEDVHAQLRDIQKRIETAIAEVEKTKEAYTTDDIVDAYRNLQPDMYSLYSIISRHVEKLKRSGRISTAHKFRQLSGSLRRFMEDKPISVFDLDAGFVEAYDAWMRQRSLKRNTRSFYHCRLRAIYNKVVKDGLVEESGRPLFENVFTGTDETAKWAITKADILRIKQLDLSRDPARDFARNIFLLSFYLRGMSFIDMAYLRKSDIKNGELTYCRHKTGQQLSIKWEQQMQDVVDALPKSATEYLLPVITENGEEGYRQYRNKMKSVNRCLKGVAQKAGITVPLSSYWARHSWSTIARDIHVEISIISKALGHNSIATTQIYLDSISKDKVDAANQLILKGF